MKHITWKKLPINLIISNVIGIPLLTIGLSDWLAHTNLMPLSLQFENYPIYLVVAGSLLILSPYSFPRDIKSD